MSKLTTPFTTIQNSASKAFAGCDWSITFGPNGINITDGMDEIATDADPEEAAEAYGEHLTSDEEA